MKLIIQVVLWIVIGFLGYKVYDSVYSAVRFQEIKEERYSKAVNQLKDIRRAQLAHKTVTGTYAKNFANLASFIDTARFTLTQRRDSSFTRYDKVFRINKSIDTVVVDILGYESVKDSLFKNTNKYKSLNKVTISDEKTAEIAMKTDVIIKNEIEYPVFKASITKESLLYDQSDNYIKQEKQVQSLEEVSGTDIFVGSLDEINTNGNWPLVYDK